MSYFEIGVFFPRRAENIGSLWRSAYQLGAAGIFTIGRPYRRQSADTASAPYEIPLRHYETVEDFLKNRPVGAALVGVEIGGVPLARFRHPQRAIYLLGSEDSGLGKKVLEHCNAVLGIESLRSASYNLAVAGALVMYHRAYGAPLLFPG
ncbi:MAG: TrmH family RNA methyltransferase [Anaerolineaceae bacterium]|nr:TrmH family RNA methyltransferase [Anaerolineaceae bacterium]